MKFINFDDIVSKNDKNYINKNVFCSSTSYKQLITGKTGCSVKQIYYSIF